jgi:uncharacterized protein YpuA (DUF1002 family)
MSYKLIYSDNGQSVKHLHHDTTTPHESCSINPHDICSVKKLIEDETEKRKEICSDIQDDICSLKKLVTEEIQIRKLMTHLLSSIGCEDTDNQIILAQQLEISKLKKDIKRISNKMEKTDEYINDLYWALFHNKPCVIAAIIEPEL